MKPSVRRWTAGILVVLCVLPLHATGEESDVEISGRAKVFGARTFLPENDLLRALDATPRDEASADLRVGARSGGALEWEIAAEIGVRHDSAGDIANGIAALPRETRDGLISPGASAMQETFEPP